MKNKMIYGAHNPELTCNEAGTLTMVINFTSGMYSNLRLIAVCKVRTRFEFGCCYQGVLEEAYRRSLLFEGIEVETDL